MVDSCERWCRGVARSAKEGQCLILCGTFGSGKTHALDASARYVNDVRMAMWPEYWPHPLNCMSVQWAKVVRELTEKDNPEYGEDLLEADVVLLDDIGSEEDRFKSGAPTRILGDYLGEMHRQKRFMFITTNIAPDGWKARWDGRVEDRLLRMDADIVNLWESRSESYASWKSRQ